MNPLVINFFKRNPEAPACHLVLTSCFKTAKTASSYQKNMGAKKVSVTLRSEYEEWLKGEAGKAAEVTENNTGGEVNERNSDQLEN